MSSYEGLFIIKPELKDEDAKNVFKVLNDLVAKNGGSVKKEEIWGKRPLAYPVKKFKEGHYYKLDFEAPGDIVPKLEGACKLNGDIIRTMISRR